MGDVEGLAKSMEHFGLIHPIVIDDERNLVAGGRRIAAAQSLRWTEVDCRPFGSLSEIERQEIELEENLQRKDLLPGERDRVIVQLAAAAAEADQLTYVDGLNVRSEPLGHRPPEPGSLRRTSERIGMSAGNLVRARQAAAARASHDLPDETAREDAINYDIAVRADPALKGQPVKDVVVKAGRSHHKQKRATVPDAREGEEQREEVVTTESPVGELPDTPVAEPEREYTTGEKISRTRRRRQFLAFIKEVNEGKERIDIGRLSEALEVSDWRAIKNFLWEFGIWTEDLTKVMQQQSGKGL